MGLSDYVEMILMQGGTFEGGFSLTDETGAPIDSSWTGRLEVRESYGGELVTAFAASGEDGTLTITDYGQVLLSLPSSASEALTSTADERGINRVHYVGDVEVWRTAAPTNRYKPQAPFRVYVRPEVTTA